MEHNTNWEKKGHIRGDREVKLSRPKHATRHDTVATRMATRLTVDHAGNARLHLRSHGSRASGSATLKSTHPAGPPKESACGNGKHQSKRSWAGRLVNGHPRLRLNTEIYPALTMPNKSRSPFSQAKVLE